MIMLRPSATMKSGAHIESRVEGQLWTHRQRVQAAEAQRAPGGLEQDDEVVTGALPRVQRRQHSRARARARAARQHHLRVRAACSKIRVKRQPLNPTS